jgi:hypothetical protein
MNSNANSESASTPWVPLPAPSCSTSSCFRTSTGEAMSQLYSKSGSVQDAVRMSRKSSSTSRSTFRTEGR